jgi:chromosome partitioning protein
MKIAITGQKGGVGKSTISICLAVLAMEKKKSVLLVDADPQGTSSTWAEVAQENGHPAPTTVQMGASMHKPGQLPKISEPFDLTIIDGPPRNNDIQRSIMMAADQLVIPCGPSASDAWALGATLELIEEAQIVRADLKTSILINRIKAGTTLGKGARDVLAESGMDILKTDLGDRISYQEALAAGLGVTTYAPHDKATNEIKDLFLELTR